MARVYSTRQFNALDFDGSIYKFIDEEGTFSCVLVCKLWSANSRFNVKKGLIVYLDFDDGRRIKAMVWSHENYLGLADMPMGTKLTVTFVRAKSNKCYLKKAESFDVEKGSLEDVNGPNQ